MHTTLIRIGNSRGVRLPKDVIEAAGLKDSLDLEVREGAVVIRAVGNVRSGWADAAMDCRGAGDDALEEWDAVADDGDLT